MFFISLCNCHSFSIFSFLFLSFFENLLTNNKNNKNIYKIRITYFRSIILLWTVWRNWNFEEKIGKPIILFFIKKTFIALLTRGTAIKAVELNIGRSAIEHSSIVVNFSDVFRTARCWKDSDLAQSKATRPDVCGFASAGTIINGRMTLSGTSYVGTCSTSVRAVSSGCDPFTPHSAWRATAL